MHTYRRTRQANLFGAAALAVCDRLDEALVHGDSRNLNRVAALVHVRLRPGRTIEFLARVLGLSHSATVRLVDGLEADRLIQRRGGADGRSLALYPTRRGERAAVEALRERTRTLDEALAPLTPAERRRLTALLEKLLAAWAGDRRSARHTCRLCDFPACTRPFCPVDEAAEGESVPVAPTAPVA
jgi:MarR family transcriptional regulator, negative regulator of the multidrug operon emrRAB